MARRPGLTPEALLALARDAVRVNPNIPVSDFRGMHGGSRDVATQALAAAKYEIANGHHRHADPSRFGRFTPLVITPNTPSPASDLDLDRLPEVLRPSVDEVLAGVREALVGSIIAAGTTAKRRIAEADERAKKDVVAAQDELSQQARECDAVELELARAMEQTAVVRQQLGAELAQIERELADARRDHEDARDELARLRGEVDSAQATAESFRAQVVESEHQRELAQKQASALETHNRELHHHLDRARDEVRQVREALSAAQTRAAHAEATIAAMRDASGREHSYLRPQAKRERTGTKSDRRTAEPRTGPAGRSRSG